MPRFFDPYGRYIKRHRKTSIFLLVFCIWFLWYQMPLKATDPNSPYFIESLFRLRDYDSPEGIKELQDKVLPKLFPVGTSKAYVDKMMIECGGADVVSQEDSLKGANLYYFQSLKIWKYLDPISIRIYYSSNRTVDAIEFGRFVVNPEYKPISLEYKP